MKYKLLIASVVLTLLVLLTYQKAFDNEFVDWDDFTYVVNNDLVRNPGDTFIKDLFSTPVSSNYHPLTVLSLRMNNNVCKECPNGISPAPFILWNVIIHILNTILVLILIYNITGKNFIIAVVSALLFGLHPMHVESVAWISERKDVLYSFFFLSGLITYYKFLTADRRKALWLVITFLLFLLSCLSKATAVVFPIVMLLLNFWHNYGSTEKNGNEAIRKSLSLKSILPVLPFLIVSLVVGLMAYKIQNGENFFGLLDLSNSTPDVVNKIGPFSVFQRFEIACYGFIVYLIKFFIPVGLYAVHPYLPVDDLTGGPFAVKLILSVIAVMIIAVTVIWSLRKSFLYFFSIGFYLITIALVLQFITVGMSMISERYTYLPYIGLALVPATIIAGSTGRIKKIMLVLVGCFVLMLMCISGKQANVWSNTETLWTKVIENHNELELPRRSRGKYYAKKSIQAKNSREKTMYEMKAFEDFKVAIKTGTNSADVYIGIGLIYASNKDLKTAVRMLTAAIQLDPKKGSAYYNRAIIYDKLNQKEDAIRDYNMALIYKTDLSWEIVNNRAGLLLETGRFTEAIRDYDYLISMDDKKYYYYCDRGFAKIQINDIPGAIMDFKQALKLNPKDSLSISNLKKLSTSLR